MVVIRQFCSYHHLLSDCRLSSAWTIVTGSRFSHIFSHRTQQALPSQTVVTNQSHWTIGRTDIFWRNCHIFKDLKLSIPYRSVYELTAFYILLWVNNVFHILLKIWHIIVWFGPNCLGKSTPSFRIYDMIKYMPKCLSHHAFIIVKMYVVNRIIYHTTRTSLPINAR